MTGSTKKHINNTEVSQQLTPIVPGTQTVKLMLAWHYEVMQMTDVNVGFR